MTESEKAALVSHCEFMISEHIKFGGYGEDEAVYRFALSVLTTPPATAQQWIPCSERLPESDEPVLIWPRPDFGVEYLVGQYGRFDKQGIGWFAQVYQHEWGIEFNPINVTHWMPISSAPEQEGL